MQSEKGPSRFFAAVSTFEQAYSHKWLHSEDAGMLQRWRRSHEIDEWMSMLGEMHASKLIDLLEIQHASAGNTEMCCEPLQ